MTLSLDQAVDLTRSGDIWLFRGRRAPDRAIRAVTNSPVNHVGMAVVVDDLPPLIFHAELGKKQMDDIQATLLDRGHIRMERIANSTHYTALD